MRLSKYLLIAVVVASASAPPAIAQGAPWEGGGYPELVPPPWESHGIQFVDWLRKEAAIDVWTEELEEDHDPFKNILVTVKINQSGPFFMSAPTAGIDCRDVVKYSRLPESIEDYFGFLLRYCTPQPVPSHPMSRFRDADCYSAPELLPFSLPASVDWPLRAYQPPTQTGFLPDFKHDEPVSTQTQVSCYLDWDYPHTWKMRVYEEEVKSLNRLRLRPDAEDFLRTVLSIERPPFGRLPIGANHCFLLAVPEAVKQNYLTSTQDSFVKMIDWPIKHQGPIGFAQEF